MKAMAFGLLGIRVYQDRGGCFVEVRAVLRSSLDGCDRSPLRHCIGGAGVEPGPDLKIKTLNGDAFPLESLEGHVAFWISGRLGARNPRVSPRRARPLHDPPRPLGTRRDM